jgi:hypothetical protein
MSLCPMPIALWQIFWNPKLLQSYSLLDLSSSSGEKQASNKPIPHQTQSFDRRICSFWLVVWPRKGSRRRIEMWGAKKSRLEIIPSTFYYHIQSRNPSFVRGNWAKFEISLGAGWKIQLLGGMTYTVWDEFYASTWTFILVLTYFGKKNSKTLVSTT